MLPILTQKFAKPHPKVCQDPPTILPAPTHNAEVLFQQIAVGVEPGLGQLVVLVLALEEVQEVDAQSR